MRNGDMGEGQWAMAMTDIQSSKSRHSCNVCNLQLGWVRNSPQPLHCSAPLFHGSAQLLTLPPARSSMRRCCERVNLGVSGVRRDARMGSADAAIT